MHMQQTQPTFSGVLTALITPMEGGDIRWDVLKELVDHQIQAGVNGLVPVGTTGESPTLDSPEHLDVISAVVEAAKGRVPVIAGTGANATSEALHLTREAAKRGADGFLQVAPYYNKPSQEGLFAHFSAIAESTDKPIMLYSIPGRCGVAIGVNTVSRLAEKFTNVRTIKEAGGDVTRVQKLHAACGDRLTILSGDDGLTLPFIAAGGSGVVSVAANLAPEPIVKMTQAALAQNFDEARKIQVRIEKLITDLVFMEGNPVTIKESMYQAGKLPAADVRLPLVRVSQRNRERIREILDTLDLS